VLLQLGEAGLRVCTSTSLRQFQVCSKHSHRCMHIRDRKCYSVRERSSKPPQQLQINKVQIRKWGQPKKGQTLQGQKTGPGHLMCCSSCSICNLTICYLLWSFRGSGNLQGFSKEATADSLLAQPSNIYEAVNPGVRATGAVDPPASATKACWGRHLGQGQRHHGQP
jgi:hypothetical protein